MGIQEARNRYHSFIDSIQQKSYALFYAYGRHASAHRGWYLLFGLLFLIFCIAGLNQFKWVKDLDSIWVQEGTRIIPERDYFNKYYGGVPRIQQFMIADSSKAKNVIQPEQLDALLNISRRIGDPTAPDLLTSEWKGKNYTELDFCEMPALNPQAAQPTSQLWVIIRISFSAYNISCSADPYCTQNVSTLPPGFYIPRVPCLRWNLLDCFIEGGYDYPPELDYISTSLQTILNSNYSHVIPAAALDRVTRLIFPGYANKPSYHDMNSEELYTYLSTEFKKQRDGQKNNCTQWNGINVPIDLVLGDLEWDGDELTRAGLTRLLHNNLDEDSLGFEQRYPNMTKSSDRKDFILNFESDLIDYYKPLWSKDKDTGFASGEVYDESDFYFLAARSTQDMVREGAKPPGIFIVGGYILLFLYASFSLAKTTRPMTDANKVYSRTGLALFGLILVALGTLGGIGLAAWFQVRFNFIVTNVVPFLSLGLGIDDMFVLAHTLPANSRDPPDRRIALALGLSGPSVTLTTVANFAAFIISASVPIPAIQGFCFIMASNVFVIWVALITMFVAMMAVDTRRIQNNKMDCCFCVTLPESKPIEQLSHINAFMAKWFAPTITKKYSEIIIIIVFMAWLGVCIWGITLVKPGLLPTDVALEGTYQEEYQSLALGRLEAAGQFFITKHSVDFPTQYMDVLNTQKDLYTLDWIIQELRLINVSWLQKFVTAYNDTNPDSNGVIPSEQWYTEFVNWIKGAGYASRNDILCLIPGKTPDDDDNRIFCTDDSINSTNVFIVASRVSMALHKINSEAKILDAIRDVRRICDDHKDEYDIDIYMYGSLFLFWEQYFHIFYVAWITIGWTLFAVFISTFLFQFSPRVSFILCLVILMIDVEIFGLMGFSNIKLNAISVVNLSMSVGLSVEFTAHLARAFLIHSGDNKERVITALQELGTPIINGAVSSFLGTLPLGLSPFPFFRTFFFEMYSYMILIAFLNGFFLLPVLLRIAGPQVLFSRDRKSEEDGFDLGTNIVLGNMPPGKDAE